MMRQTGATGVDLVVRFFNRRQILYALLLLAMPVVMIGCTPNRQTASGTAEITLDLHGTSVGPAQVDVQITDEQGQPIIGADVQLRGDMTHAGMQPVITLMHDNGDGQYVAHDFAFTMAGDWILSVEATLPDGTRAQRMFEVLGVTNE